MRWSKLFTKKEPTRDEKVMLMALQSKPMYQGTVPGAYKAKRRAENKRARAARRVQRARQ